MASSKWLRALLAALGLCAAACAHADPEIGWYWNPAESGRGFFVESAGGITYLAGYLYTEDGRALWLAAGAPNGDPYNFSGRLQEFSHGQTLFGDYVFPAAPIDRGAVTVHFTDDQHATITWPGGVVQIERDIFGAGTPDLPVFSGWWWSADESGRGYSLEVQGGNLFIVGFMYDDAGNAVWYFSAGPMASASSYSGQWYQFSGGQTLTGAYRPPAQPIPVANLSIEFAAADQATLTWSDLGGAQSGEKWVELKRTKTKIITPQFPKCTAPLTTFPSRYDSTLTETITDTVVIGGLKDVYTGNVTANLQWGISTLVTPSPFGNDPCGKPIKAYQYMVVGGTIHIDYTETETGPGTSCSLKGNKDFAVPADVDLSSDANLVIGAYGRYTFDFNVPGAAIPFTATATCTTGGVPITTTRTINSLTVTMGHNEGAAIYGVHGGGTSMIDTLTRKFHYDIAAVKQ